MSRAASRSKRSRSTVMERGKGDATPIRTSRAVSVSRTPLDVPRAAFAEQFAAPTAWSSVCVTRTPLHDNEAGLRYRDAAPNVRCGVRLRKLPLDSSGAELLRRHTAPEGWSGVLLLTLDRHPAQTTHSEMSQTPNRQHRQHTQNETRTQAKFAGPVTNVRLSQH